MPTIPPRESLPTKTSDPNYAEKLDKVQERNANRMLLIQAKMAQSSEERATRSNMQKSGHDAMMSVINNFKS